jgi:hypothetical protein
MELSLMELTLQLFFYVLAFNAVIILLAFLWYLKTARHQKIAVDFEEYIASLPRNAKICDPYIFVDGKWVKTNKSSQNTSPSLKHSPS